MKSVFLAAGLALSASAVAAEEATPPNEPYRVTVWADVSYDVTGNPTQIEFPDRDKYPAKFIQSLMVKLATRHIDPPLDHGVPATFDTGELISLTVTPSATDGQVHVDAIEEMPRILKMATGEMPEDLRQANWSGIIRVRCMIGVDGSCIQTQILGTDAVPQSARKLVLTAMKAWRFKPQRINGKPAEFAYAVPYNFVNDEMHDRPHIKGNDY